MEAPLLRASNIRDLCTAVNAEYRGWTTTAVDTYLCKPLGGAASLTLASSLNISRVTSHALLPRPSSRIPGSSGPCTVPPHQCSASANGAHHPRPGFVPRAMEPSERRLSFSLYPSSPQPRHAPRLSPVVQRRRQSQQSGRNKSLSAVSGWREKERRISHI